MRKNLRVRKKKFEKIFRRGGGGEGGSYRNLKVQSVPELALIVLLACIQFMCILAIWVSLLFPTVGISVDL